MKHSSIAFFVVAIVSIYGVLNFYIIKRSSQALHDCGHRAIFIIIILMVLAAAYPCGRIAEIWIRNFVTHGLMSAGAGYLGFFFYAVALTFFVDVLRLVQRMSRLVPAETVNSLGSHLPLIWLCGAGCIIVACIVGYFLDTHPRIKSYDITIPKKTEKTAAITIAAVSDIHFGEVLGERHLAKIAGRISQINPSSVLILGDLFDEKVTESQERTMSAFLRGISRRFPVYAISGNHDYFCGISTVRRILDEAGVVLLQDSAIIIDNTIVLAGRKDRMVRRMGETRKSLTEILQGTGRDVPCIVMDHQPFHLEEAMEAGIALQLSGHTHHGQLFPLNLLYRWVYEKSWGYLRKGETQYIVSCGAGTWGPPIRTNSFSEVLKINLRIR